VIEQNIASFDGGGVFFSAGDMMFQGVNITQVDPARREGRGMSSRREGRTAKYKYLSPYANNLHHPSP
jgi:hypothetical protein